MKIISLNTWGGRGGLENLIKFFKENDNTDIFCLQEIWSEGKGNHMVGVKAGGELITGVSTTLLQDIEKVLPNYTIYFRPHFFDYYGLAMFVKKDLKVVEEGDIFVYKEHGYISEEETGNHARNVQYVTVETKNGLRTIVNFHGLWNGKGKTDTDDRLLQSDNIIKFLKNLSNPFILCGDFNLRPDTESIKKFEDFGLKNLIKEYGVTSTRTSLYKKSAEKFADYALVSREIEVEDFKIMPEEVSDHSAMLIHIK